MIEKAVNETAVTITDVNEAAERIGPYAHRTPVLTSQAINDLAGRELFFKCENFQKVGAFKFRGACNAVLRLTDADAARGVVTHSSGNHAQALALAAKMRGIQAHIVMPTSAPAVKRRAVEGYGAIIYDCEPTLEARETTAAAVIENTGATLIHPYDNAEVIAGQGTCALELVQEVSRHQGIEASTVLDAIVAPIGGGGLMSGTCITTRAISPTTRIIGAEPSGADDAARSLAAGRFIPQTGPNTIADGLLTSLGKITWPIVRDHVERIITVDDAAVMAAMRLVWERMKIVIEPSSATVLAAVLSDEFRTLDGIKRVGLIISGGNVDLDRLPWMR